MLLLISSPSQTRISYSIDGSMFSRILKQADIIALQLKTIVVYIAILFYVVKFQKKFIIGFIIN